MINYPKTLRKNIEFRAFNRQKASNDIEHQILLKELCIRDRLFFFNVFLWTFDPRRQTIKNIPFITYEEFQDEAILWDAECKEKQIDNLYEKTRDMGITWILVGNDLYDWLFSPDKSEYLWGSRKEEYVDRRGDIKTIFEKFRHALKNLPKWMMPKGFDWNEHDNFMRLVNPETGSAIIGESANANFSRAGRFTRVRFDEFAFWDNDESSWQAAADTTNCRTALSTVNGSGNKFSELAHSNIAKKTLHWTMHPLKNPGTYILDPVTGEKTEIHLGDDPHAAFKIWEENRHIVPPQGMIGGIVRSPWYDAECERRKSAKEVAEELDIDYLRSGAPFFDNRAVKMQQVWKYYVRENPTDPIKTGYHVKGIIIDSADKYSFRETPHGWLKLYEAPRRGGQYVVSADVSEGLEKGDESFIVVRDKYTRNVCAVANGAYDPETVTIYVQKLGMFFNKAKVAPENNNMGHTVNSRLQEMDCDLYWTTRKNKKGARERIKAGWTTTATTRPLMLDQAAEDIKKLACEVRDEVILDQMLTFVHNEKNGKPEADGSFLDDGVIAFAIGGQVINEYPYEPKAPEVPTEIYNKMGKKNAGFSFRT